MGLVDDQRVVAAQHAVALDLGEEDAVGHHAHERVVADAVVEAHGVPDGRADGRVELAGEALGDRAGGDAARLGVPDQPGDTAAGLDAQLRQLRALARTGLAGDDQHLVLAERGEQLVVPGGDRQFGGIADRSGGDERVTDGATAVVGGGAAVHAASLVLVWVERADRTDRPIRLADRPRLAVKWQSGGCVPNVYVLPDQRLVECRPGEPILPAALRAGIPFTHACGGRARCSTCRIVVVEGWQACAGRNPREQAIANQLGFRPEFRLACQTVVTGDVTIRRLVLDQRDVELADVRLRPVAAAATPPTAPRPAARPTDRRRACPSPSCSPTSAGSRGSPRRCCPTTSSTCCSASSATSPMRSRTKRRRRDELHGRRRDGAVRRRPGPISPARRAVAPYVPGWRSFATPTRHVQASRSCTAGRST